MVTAESNPAVNLLHQCLNLICSVLLTGEMENDGKWTHTIIALALLEIFLVFYLHSLHSCQILSYVTSRTCVSFPLRQSDTPFYQSCCSSTDSKTIHCTRHFTFDSTLTDLTLSLAQPNTDILAQISRLQALSRGWTADVAIAFVLTQSIARLDLNVQYCVVSCPTCWVFTFSG